MIIRPATATYAAAMTSLLNEIIRVGGTTAHDTPFTEAEVYHHYIQGPDAICCHLAEVDGAVLGFQALGLYPVLPEGWLDIGTFVATAARGTGAGTALFAATKAMALERGCRVINATIRADNLLGLGFYTRLGFVDYALDPDFALKSGEKVGRVSKRYDLV